jgi:hypothetical protein
VHERPAVKGVVPGIGPDDEVVLWGGGIYDWFDPVTAIEAVALLKERRPALRLWFLGVRHPNTAILDSPKLAEARARAEELGVAGTHVFFNEGWVAYEDRQDHLLEADVAISLHREHIEAAYSFRTRILDYLWAGLPIVATRGDTFADIIAGRGLGEVVPGGDAAAVAEALDRLLSDKDGRSARKEAAARVAAGFVWSEVLAPLVRFCSEPLPAADRESLIAWPAVPPPPPPEAPFPAPPAVPPGLGVRARSVAARAAGAYRRGGPAELARAGTRFARRRLGGPTG